MMQDSSLDNPQQYLQEDLRFGADSDISNVDMNRYASEDEHRHYGPRYLLKNNPSGDMDHEPFGETAARAAEALSLSLPPHNGPFYVSGHYENVDNAGYMGHAGHHMEYHSHAPGHYFPGSMSGMNMPPMMPTHAMGGRNNSREDYNPTLLEAVNPWGDAQTPSTVSTVTPNSTGAGRRKGANGGRKRSVNGQIQLLTGNNPMLGAMGGLAMGLSNNTTAHTSPDLNEELGGLLSDGIAPSATTGGSETPTETKRRRGGRHSSSTHMTPDEKRARFLERNRQAASKCRQKKKQWMQELEHKSSEIFQRNRDLTLLVSTLRDEIHSLKTRMSIYDTQCTCNVSSQLSPRGGHSQNQAHQY